MTLAIVMYHYVRPLKTSAFPRIRGLDLALFESQLRHFQRHHHVVTTKAVLAHREGVEHLPPNSIWLTFDDGYKDHIEFVAPLLDKYQIKGAFFPPAQPILEQRLLAVNAAQHLLAVTQDPIQLIQDLKQEMFKHGYRQHDWDTFQTSFSTAGRWDTAEVIFFKRMIQRELPDTLRQAITSSLFEQAIGESESEFSKKLYCSQQELSQLNSAGHTLGNHTYSHPWLNALNANAQEKEITLGLSFLEGLGVNLEKWIMCYPYGAHNTKTLAILQELNCAIGLSTEPGNAEPHHPALSLPRWDTNDFIQVSAETDQTAS